MEKETYNNVEDLSDISKQMKDMLNEQAETIYVDYDLPKKQLTFNLFPKNIREKIIKQVFLLFLVNIVCGMLLILGDFYLELFVLMIGIDVFLGSNTVMLYLETKTNDFMYFSGYIGSLELHGFLPNEKTYTIKILSLDKKRVLTINYPASNKVSIEEGDPITVIISNNEPIKMSDTGPFIDNYLDVVFTILTPPDEENEELNGQVVTAAEYFDESSDEEIKKEISASDFFNDDTDN